MTSRMPCTRRLRSIRAVVAGACLVAWLGLPAAVLAENATPPEAGAVPAEDVAADVQTLDTVVVSGRAPGPGLWRVGGQDGRVLWVLGVLSPVPAGMDWDSTRVAALVARADEVLWEPYYTVDVDTGFFGRLRLGYGMWRARGNPGGRTLGDVLPEPLYRRWSRARERLLPRDGGVERDRPIVAAAALLDAAIADAGMTGRDRVLAPVLEAVEAHDVPVRTPGVEVELPPGVAKQAVRALRATSLDDVACLEATLDAIDNDLPRMITNANAWAAGRLDRIRFDDLERRRALCTDALTNARFAREHGIPDIRASIADRWLAEARSALDRNTVTVAVVSLADLVGPEGYVARLETLGYEVRRP
jgi:hypothetical protein